MSFFQIYFSFLCVSPYWIAVEPLDGMDNLLRMDGIEPLDAIIRTKTMERLEHVLVVTSKWN